MRVVIAGGGTGGHLFPGLALASEFKARESEAGILFVGTRKGIEEKVVPKEGYDIRFINAEGLVNVGLYKTMRSILRLPAALAQSRSILSSFDPHVVIGVGGYASGPVLAMASLMSYPTMIHEQNAVPGLTNRILGKLCDSIAITYPDSAAWFSSRKTRLTGNPVRKTMGTVGRDNAMRSLGLDAGLFTLLVLGGSRGAHKINSAMVEAFREFPEFRERVQVIHQTGESDEKEVIEAYRAMSVHGAALSFLYDIHLAYAAADLVLCRAGASTLAELSVCGKAAILVPYPYAARNHQEVNAGKLFDLGACRVIRDSELTGRRLGEEILDLSEDPRKLAGMERESRAVGRPDSARRIVDMALELCRRKGVL